MSFYIHVWIECREMQQHLTCAHDMNAVWHTCHICKEFFKVKVVLKRHIKIDSANDISTNAFKDQAQET